MKWTKEQEKAITTKDCNLLVAAGAGSGKTAVLVERIIQKVINDKIDIDKLLVVTFTNAAASEMKERISNSLYKELEVNPALQRQITLLNKANITTIHSFCLRVIRDNFFKLDLDPNFRIGDETELELLKLDAIEELMEEKYECEDEEFQDLIEVYTSNKDDVSLRDLILNIYNFIQSSPFPNDWLKEKCDMYNTDETDFAKTIWGKILIDSFNTEIYGLIDELKKIKEDILNYGEAEKYVFDLEEIIFNLQAIVTKTGTWDEKCTAVQCFEMQRMPIVKGISEDVKEQVKEIRGKVKESVIENFRNKIFISSSSEIFDDLKVLYKTLVSISKCVVEFEKKYEKKKKEKNVIDFNDIEHMCLKLFLENEDIVDVYKNKFEEILIDEYQDSNLIQEYIINKIAKGKMFMVGDIKQSIYRFRQARPEIFLGKYNSYTNVFEKEVQNQKLLLFKNFRSNRNVVNSVNYIFSHIMSVDVGEIDYTEEEYLKFGAEYYLKDGEETEIHLIENEQDDMSEDIDIEDKPQLEGKVIAKRISELVGNFEVYDKNNGQMRKAEYRDIVILLRSTVNYSDYFVQELSNMSIPVYSDNNSGYFENPEIQIVLSLLKIIDNPMQDIPLIAVMRSQIGNFTIDELTEIRLTDKACGFYNAMQKVCSQTGELSNKVRSFLKNLDSWREKSKYLSLYELLWELYNQTGYYYYVLLFPDGLKRQANLKLLLERADSFEKTSYKGVFNFLNYLENVKQSSGDFGSSKIIGENENVVRIMSIHKSKGLEFPIVFLAGTSKKFNTRDLTDKVVFHHELGFGANIIKPDKRIAYPSIPKLAIMQQIKKESLSEELRILYVAMTRAREKLIITASTNKIDKLYDKLSNPLTKYSILKANKLIDWIGTTAIGKDNDWIIKKWQYSDVAKLSVSQRNVEIYKMTLENINNTFTAGNNYNEINKKLSWKYDFEKATVLPTKVSISTIKKSAVSNLNDISLKIEEIVEKPKCLLEENKEGAEYGTILHRVMQRLDFKNGEVDLDNVPDMMKESIKKHIEDFKKTEIFERIRAAERVYRESPFNLNIPANEIYDMEEKYKHEKIMIQGIIDLYFVENGEIVLLDYKTDNVKNEKELIDLYRGQLEIYKRALEEITGKRVKEALIYSFKLKFTIKLT